MNYTKQKSNNHYLKNYDNLGRFVSYYNQKNIILKLAHKISLENNLNISDVRVLEIGKGSGFLIEYLKSYGIKVETFDVAEDLSPDYLGDVMSIDEIVKGKYDIIVCFQTLEHIKFENFSEIITKICGTTNKYFVFSVPQIRFYVSFWIKFPIFPAKSFYLSLPFPLKHVFDGEHYWELGKAGFGFKKFRGLVEKIFKINDEFTDPLNPYHRFFVCEKNNNN